MTTSPCPLSLGGAAHGEGEGEAAQVVCRSQGISALALGILRQFVGFGVGGGVVDCQGDDAVVGQPAVADGFDIALAIELYAEDGLVVHGADYPIAVFNAAGTARVVDAGRGGLVDAVGGWKGVIVVAEGKVSNAPLLFGQLPIPWLGLCGASLQSCELRQRQALRPWLRP